VYTLLGVVLRARQDKNGEPVAWVRPLVDITTIAWREADPKEFPPKGLFWPRAAGAVLDSLVFLQPKENTNHDPTIKDEFMVGDTHPALEVLDLRRFGNEEQIRLGLTTTGFKIPGNHPARTLILCAENVVVGPVGLVVAPSGTTVEKANRQRIPCFRLKQSDVRTVSYDGISRHVCAKTSLGAPDAYVDWDDDKQVVRRAMEYAVYLANKSRSNVDRAKQLIEDTAEEVTKEGSLADIELSLNRMQRVRSLIKSIQQATGVANEVASALLKHPNVRQEIEQLRVREQANAKAAVDAALKSEREELGRLQQERTAAGLALKAAKKAAEEAEAEAERKASEIEGKIRTRIEETIRSTPDLLAQISVLKPFLGGITGAPSKSGAEALPVYPRWKVGPVALSTIKELRTRIIPVLKALGIQVSTYHRLHAAFAARLMPVLAGPRALEALKAYAQVAAGGRMAVVQVTSSLAEAGDIFGRVHPARNRFLPHAAGLIDILLAAQQSEGFMLAVLDGANRGATESYLLPLLRAAVRRSGEISLFHPLAVDADEPYRACARMTWPENLLLAATLVEGPTTLPVASDVWADSVLIQTDVGESPSSVQTANLPTDISEIDPKGPLLPSQTPPGDHASTDSLDGIVKSNDIRDVASRFERALSAFQSDPTALQVELVRGVLVPWVASIANDEDRAGAIADISKTLGAKASVGLQEAVEGARRRTA